MGLAPRRDGRSAAARPRVFGRLHRPAAGPARGLRAIAAHRREQRAATAATAAAVLRVKEIAAGRPSHYRCWNGLPRRYTSHAIRVLRVRRRWRSMPMVPWRTVFFAVNFGTTVLFVIACVVGVGEWLVVGGSPFAFLGAVCFIGPALAFGITEWLLYVRKVRNLERPLGVVCGLVGGLAIFAFISNAAEPRSKVVRQVSGSGHTYGSGSASARYASPSPRMACGAVGLECVAGRFRKNGVFLSAVRRHHNQRLPPQPLSGVPLCSAASSTR